MRTPGAMVKVGLGLLSVSLLATLSITGADGAVALALFGWVAQCTLYVGIGFVIAGSVLHVLRPQQVAGRRGEAPFGQTDYWGG